MEKLNIINELHKAIEHKKILHLKEALPQVLEWKDFINILDYKFHKDDMQYEHYDPRHIKNGDKTTNLFIYNRLDPVIMGVSYIVDHKIDFNDGAAVQDFINLAADIFDAHEFIGVKAIMNLVGKEADYWIHKDNEDVLSWHCIGTVEWRIFKDIKDEHLNQTSLPEHEYTSIILQPGDLLYIPKRVAHQVIVTEPRASIIAHAWHR